MAEPVLTKVTLSSKQSLVKEFLEATMKPRCFYSVPGVSASWMSLTGHSGQPDAVDISSSLFFQVLQLASNLKRFRFIKTAAIKRWKAMLLPTQIQFFVARPQEDGQTADIFPIDTPAVIDLMHLVSDYGHGQLENLCQWFPKGVSPSHVASGTFLKLAHPENVISGHRWTVHR